MCVHISATVAQAVELLLCPDKAQRPRMNCSTSHLMSLPLAGLLATVQGMAPFEFSRNSLLHVLARPVAAWRFATASKAISALSTCGACYSGVQVGYDELRAPCSCHPHYQAGDANPVKNKSLDSIGKKGKMLGAEVRRAAAEARVKLGRLFDELVADVQVNGLKAPAVLAASVS
jgi:hypothetical protein